MIVPQADTEAGAAVARVMCEAGASAVLVGNGFTQLGAVAAKIHGAEHVRLSEIQIGVPQPTEQGAAVLEDDRPDRRAGGRRRFDGFGAVPYAPAARDPIQAPENLTEASESRC